MESRARRRRRVSRQQARSSCRGLRPAATWSSRVSSVVSVSLLSLQTFVESAAAARRSATRRTSGHRQFDDVHSLLTNSRAVQHLHLLPRPRSTYHADLTLTLWFSFSCYTSHEGEGYAFESVCMSVLYVFRRKFSGWLLLLQERQIVGETVHIVSMKSSQFWEAVVSKSTNWCWYFLANTIDTLKTRICAAEMAVRYAALAEKYMCVIVIR